jgi:hypothetical protein
MVALFPVLLRPNNAITARDLDMFKLIALLYV